MDQTNSSRGASRTLRGSVVVGGGSFWGLQEAMRHAPGVIWTSVGYSGGNTLNPTYTEPGDHAEAVEVWFDPARTSLREVLLWFMRLHDPTTQDRQGEDYGSRYRSLILTSNEEDFATARTVLAAADASQRWPGRIVTEVAALQEFWPAEPSHQDHLQHHPDGYNAHFERTTWRIDE